MTGSVAVWTTTSSTSGRRISPLLVDHLGHAEIVIEAVARAEVLQAGRWAEADLARKSDRVLIEHAELVRARNQEHCEIHSL